MSGRLRVSVVVPTHGRQRSLVRVLRALAHQDIPAESFEVVVVCDGDVDASGDACRALAGELPYHLRVIEQPHAGPAGARNRGVAGALAPLIIFLDDDVVPDERLIAAHLEAQSGQEMRVAIGPLLPPPDVRLSAWGAWEERMLCRQYDDLEAARWKPGYRQFYTGNASLLKRHLIAAGGFNTAYHRAEDVELGLRLHFRGLHFVYLPEARAWHYVSRSFASWQRMASAYGEADVALARTVHSWVLEVAARDFQGRHRLTRTLSILSAGRPRAVAMGTAALGALARAAHAVRLERLASGSCSAVFNLRYYDGVARALGGRKAFLRLVAGAPVSAFIDHLPERQVAEAY